MPCSEMNGPIRLRAPVVVNILGLISSTGLDHERCSSCRG